MIKLENIEKSYKDIALFKNLNLEIPDGAHIAIQGVNGSGKSVLLKMICGYSKPDRGSVIIDGRKLDKNENFIQNAGVSINAPEFIDSLSGLDNLMYLIHIRKIATKEEVLQMAKYLNLEGLNKKYKTYSLGMRQKMRLIQALVEKPKYIILDEPFDALDDDSKKAAMKLLIEYTHGKTFIFISHNQDDIDALADTVYKINNYQLIKVK